MSKVNSLDPSVSKNRVYGGSKKGKNYCDNLSKQINQYLPDLSPFNAINHACYESYDEQSAEEICALQSFIRGGSLNFETRMMNL